MSENPYEYHDYENEPIRINQSGWDYRDCPFPAVPFEISCRYKGKPARMTAERDRLRFEGEGFSEILYVERDTPIHVRYWYTVWGGNLTFRFHGRLLRLKVRGEKSLLLKLGRLVAWNRCISDPDDAKAVAVEASEKFIYFMPFLLTLAMLAENIFFIINGIPLSEVGIKYPALLVNVIVCPLICLFCIGKRRVSGILFIPIVLFSLLAACGPVYLTFGLFSPLLINLLGAVCVGLLTFPFHIVSLVQLWNLSRQLKKSEEP
ncbi:MAG: hypothetical protein LBQ54_15040 [Planctomycetaceae bacterium]|nr:hypothetical protein [Planctomycetaceae bacterium]